MPRAFARDYSLDALRGIAISLVVLYHYASEGAPRKHLASLNDYLHAVLSLGWAGVDLFFVLSGFLIGGILIDNRNASNFFRVFYLRRVARIFPLYVLVIVLSLLLVPELRQFGVFIYYATFTQNMWILAGHHWGVPYLTVTWSLALEEQFYLIAPIIVRFLVPAALPRVLIVLLLIAPVCRALCWVIFPPDIASRAATVLLPCKIDALALGMLLAVAVRNPVWKARLCDSALRTAGVAITCGTIVLLMVFAGVNWRHPMFSLIGFTFIAVGWGAVLVLGITQKERHGWFRIVRALAPVGIGAYSIYLFHIFGPMVARNLIDWEQSGDVARSTMLFAFNFVVAWGLWRLVERPFIRLGHRAQYRAGVVPSVAEPSPVH